VIRAVFLDRDGVINRKAPEGDYIKNWGEFNFLPDVAETIRVLNENSFKIIIVTNQRGIALGLMTIADLETIHRKMIVELQNKGAHIDKIYYCPHEKDSCSCRKPGIGMFMNAKMDLPGLSFTDSFVIGDSLSDMEAGKKLSCKCILISNNLSNVSKIWYYYANSLYEALNKYIITYS
jgi:D-glycero-D-manno-heptose 1,7-bisphosphate phosphatase